MTEQVVGGGAPAARAPEPYAYLAWLGAMSFVVYNYVIYTTSVRCS